LAGIWDKILEASGFSRATESKRVILFLKWVWKQNFWKLKLRILFWSCSVCSKFKSGKVCRFPILVDKSFKRGIQFCAAVKFPNISRTTSECIPHICILLVYNRAHSGVNKMNKLSIVDYNLFFFIEIYSTNFFIYL
jgi:hypothetical protein